AVASSTAVGAVSQDDTYAYDAAGRLSGDGRNSYGYDAGGNPTAYGEQPQSFDAAHQLQTSGAPASDPPPDPGPSDPNPGPSDPGPGPVSGPGPAPSNPGGLAGAPARTVGGGQPGGSSDPLDAGTTSTVKVASAVVSRTIHKDRLLRARVTSREAGQLLLAF